MKFIQRYSWCAVLGFAPLPYAINEWKYWTFLVLMVITVNWSRDAG